MHRVTVIDLEGQATPFRIHEDAYDALSRYLGHARLRLAEDPDGKEILADLERSIGEKLAERRGGGDRILAMADVAAVLNDVGPVGGEGAAAAAPSRPRRRRLYRIKAGQEIAGVCEGVSAYTEIDVAWVRTIFFALALVTAGIFILVYLALVFILPITATRETWVAELDDAARAAADGRV